ncbi:MAG: PAS domain S-box protein, partial [Pyrinomonadaceae bacterium]
MTDSFTFPDSAARNSMERSPQSEAILVVNDAPDQLALASAVLRQAGYEVHTAADGRQGIERARQLRPAIVVSDVNMPHLSGIELCRVMHADPDLRHTPVLLMSAMRKDTVSVVEGLKAGAEDYLEAPYEPLRLVAKVTRLLERARVEAHYRDIVEQSADVIYTVDLAGRLTSINRAGAEFAGRAPEALIGVHIGEALGIAAEEVSGGIARLLEHGEPRRELAEARTQGGGRGWLEFSNSLIIGRDGTPVGVRGAARDVTTQQLMASQLRRQADLLDQTFDAIIVSEFRGPIVFWNQGAERLYGYERSVAEGNSRHELLQASHPRGTKDFEDELERTGRWAGELLHATRDGRRIFVESQQALVRQDDEHLYVLEVNRNITDRKRAEEALRESEEKFRTLSEACLE